MNNSLIPTPADVIARIRQTGKWTLWIILILLLVTGANPFVTINAGNRGVVFDRLRGGVQEQVLDEGLKLKVPYFQSIIELPVRTQRIVFTGGGGTGNKSLSYASSDFMGRASQHGRMLAASSDLQDVYVDAVITYHLEPSQVGKIYQTVGTDFENKKVVPRAIDVVKTHTAKFKVAEILTKREEIRNQIIEDLKARLAVDGIILEDVELTNFDFNAEFKAAIERKQIAEQEAETEENKLRQKEIQVQQTIKIAEADKQAKILEGESIAEYNRLIQQEITPQVIEYKQLENQREAINKWSGTYPTTYFGGESGAVPLINLGNEE